MARRKTIAMPGAPDLDLTPILPLINTPHFQRLQGRRQLGTSYVVFPEAHHTRYSHGLGTYQLTRKRTSYWRQDDVITNQQAWSMCLFGLLHDIGHGPYSHATELLAALDHKQRGLVLLGALRDQITEIGAEVAEIERMMSGQHPLACAVSHRPCGADKLDYLWRDARFTKEGVGFRMGDILHHTHLQHGELVVDRRFEHEAKKVMEAYVYMHHSAYFRKTSLIAQRFLQKIVALEMAEAGASVTPDSVLSLTDSQLDGFLLASRSARVRCLFSRLLERRLPKCAVSLVPQDVTTNELDAKKDSALFRVAEEQLTQLDVFQKPDRAFEIERGIAEMLNITADEVLFIPVTSIDRFMPPDMAVYDEDEEIGTLYERWPMFRAKLLEEVAAYVAVRVCVPEKYRKRAAAPAMAQRICEYLLSKVGERSSAARLDPVGAL